MALGKAEVKGLARRYAEGFYKTCKSLKLEKRGLSFLEEVCQKFEDYPEVRKIFGHPKISREEKNALVERMCGAEEPQVFVEFFKLLSRRQRLTILEEVKNRFREIYEEEIGVIRGEVRTPYPLSREQKERLERALTRRWGKRVNVEETFDPEVIGGIAVILGGKIIDGTVRNQLEKIRKHLMSEEFWKGVKGV